MTETTEDKNAGTAAAEPLTKDELRGLDAYWRAANCLSVP